MLDLPVRYSIRAAVPSDEDGLLEVAEFLDSVNLPNDRDEVAALTALSEESFSGRCRDPRRRRYVFVLRDEIEDRIVGTSMLIGQKGRKDAPYIYFSVKKNERYSPRLDHHFVHQVLQIGYSYDGPTEIGGLVMHPELRRAPEKLGMLISYVRFLWIAMHPSEVQDHVLAELMPPLEADGTSRLWEAVGRHFTGLTYREADRLSKHDKRFIRNLFPEGGIYASLLAPEAQAVIGQVGPQTRGVEKLLRRIGFRYVERVDPFDGGPHFMAPTADVELVQRAKRSRVEAGEGPWTARALLAREDTTAPWFEALPTPFRVAGDSIVVPEDVARRLSAEGPAFLDQPALDARAGLAN